VGLVARTTLPLPVVPLERSLAAGWLAEGTPEVEMLLIHLFACAANDWTPPSVDDVGFGTCEALSFELESKPAYPPAVFLLVVTSQVEQEIVFVDRERGELKVSTLSAARCSAEKSSIA
jgi:hypothetical protein